MELLGWKTAAAVSGISRHSSEGSDALDGWGSAIRPTADDRSVVRQFAVWTHKRHSAGHSPRAVYNTQRNSEAVLERASDVLLRA